MSTDAAQGTGVVYPESDGKPMADNTLQWDWMVKIVGELREQFAGQEVFVAGDLFWYPIEADFKTAVAPDALVAFGRPAGYRGSYRQWEEGNVAPQVVFEIRSPSNTDDELDEKIEFYSRHGVEEYYFIDPDPPAFEVYLRRGKRLGRVRDVKKGFVSPRLGVRFVLDGDVRLFHPDGREFQTRETRVAEILEELRKTALAFEEEHARAINEARRAEAAAAQAVAAARRADEEAHRATAAADQAREEARRAAAFAAKLRELGVEPDDLLRPAS